MQPLVQLVKKLSCHPSTEELILFVGSNEDLVRTCLKLHEQLLEPSHSSLTEITSVCHEHQVTLEELAREVRCISNIFSPAAVNSHYDVLGLQPGATVEEVKKAFRRLSIQYHPDTSGDGDSRAFVEINLAYQAILKGGGAPVASSFRVDSSWRHTKESGQVKKPRQRQILWLSGVAVLFFVMSVLAQHFYKKQVMLSNLNTIDPILAKNVSRNETVVASVVSKATMQLDSATSEIVGLNYQTVDAGGALTSHPPDKKSDGKQQSVKVIVVSIDNGTEKKARGGVKNIRRNKRILLPGQRIIPETDDKRHALAMAHKYSPPQIVTDALGTSSGNLIAHENDSVVLSKSVPLKQLKAVRKKKRFVAPILQERNPGIKNEKSAIQHRKVRPDQAVTSLGHAGSKVDMVKINRFFQQYIAAYEGKDLAGFSRLFSPEATENNFLFIQQHDKYVHLFQHVDEIHLQISIISSSKQDDFIRIRGRFVLQLSSSHSATAQKTGPISFLLIAKGNQYKVMKLQYTFDS